MNLIKSRCASAKPNNGKQVRHLTFLITSLILMQKTKTEVKILIKFTLKFVVLTIFSLKHVYFCLLELWHLSVLRLHKTTTTSWMLRLHYIVLFRLLQCFPPFSVSAHFLKKKWSWVQLILNNCFKIKVNSNI